MPSPVDTHLAAAAAGLVAGLALYRLARGSSPPPVHQVSAYAVLRASVDAEDDRVAEGHAYDETLAVQGQAAEPMADYDKRTASGSHYVTRIVLTGACLEPRQSTLPLDTDVLVQAVHAGGSTPA